MMKIVPINNKKILPVVEFAETLENSKIRVSKYADRTKKMLIFYKIEDENIKIGDTRYGKVGDEAIFGLLFHKEESIDVVIKHLEMLKNMSEED